MPNSYLKGVVVLASRPRAKAGESVIGINWGQLFYNPKGLIDDVMNHPKSPELQLQAQNGYWGTQRTAGQVNTAANRLGNTTAQQQLQATLQQQAAANAASLRAQFATTFPNVAMPTAPPAPFQVPQPMYGIPATPYGSVPPVVTSYDASGNPIYADPNAVPVDPSQSVVGAQNAYWGATKASDAASSANLVALRQQANASVNAAMAQEAATIFQPVDTAALAAAAQAANPYGSSEYGVDSEPYYADGGGDEGSPYDVVGAAPTDQYVVVHVKDIGSVVKAQSKLGGIAYGALPQTIASVAYGKIRDQISSALASAGVAADVTVTTTPPVGKSTRDIFVGILAGAGGAAALWALAKLVMHKPHTGRR